MSTTIDGRTALVADIVDNLEGLEEVNDAVAAGLMNPIDLLEKILPEFGRVDNGRFYTVWNEYYEGYNPASEFMSFIALYYGIRQYGTKYWYFSFDSFGEGANAYEVSEKTGVQFDLDRK